MNLWTYFHLHWQDNVIAGFIYTAIAWPIGYIMGIRKHFHRLHQHLHEQDAKTTLLHRHIKQIHKKVHE